VTVRVRPAVKSDRGALEDFTCAPEVCPPWLRQIQVFLRAHALPASHRRANSNDHALMLVEQHDPPLLIGVVSLGRYRTIGVDGWLIDTAAVALAWQGSRLNDGRRASDVVLAAAFDHIRSADADRLPATVFANVHRDNGRSIGVLRRNGFIGFEPDPDLDDHLLAAVKIS